MLKFKLLATMMVAKDGLLGPGKTMLPKLAALISTKKRISLTPTNLNTT